MNSTQNQGSSTKKLEGGLRVQGFFKNSCQESPLVSIVTVVFNGKKYLENTIESVINQSYKNIEYIIVDGASTDGTIDILQRYSGSVDYWVSEPDKGIYDAMNKGISFCSGSIIGILNSDDFYEHGTIEKVVKAFTAHPSYLLVHGAMRRIDCNGRTNSIYGSKKKISSSLTVPFNHPTCFFKKYFYEKYGMFDTQFSTAADYDLMLRFQKENLLDLYIDEVFTNFRMVGVTSSKSFPAIQIYSLLRKNGFSRHICLLAILYRMSTFFLKNLLLNMKLKKVNLMMRSLISYHKKVS